MKVACARCKMCGKILLDNRAITSHEHLLDNIEYVSLAGEEICKLYGHNAELLRENRGYFTGGGGGVNYDSGGCPISEDRGAPMYRHYEACFSCKRCGKQWTEQKKERWG